MAPPTMEAGNSVVTFNLLATPESKEIMFKFSISRFPDIKKPNEGKWKLYQIYYLH